MLLFRYRNWRHEHAFGLDLFRQWPARSAVVAEEAVSNRWTRHLLPVAVPPSVTPPPPHSPKYSLRHAQAIEVHVSKLFWAEASPVRRLYEPVHRFDIVLRYA